VDPTRQIFLKTKNSLGLPVPWNKAILISSCTEMHFLLFYFSYFLLVFPSQKGCEETGISCYSSGTHLVPAKGTSQRQTGTMPVSRTGTMAAIYSRNSTE